MTLFQTVRARKRAFFWVLGSTLVLAALLSVVLPYTYVAEASVVVDSKGTDPITGAVVPTLLLPGFVATQVEMIQAHSTALKVVDKLHLENDPKYRDDFMSDMDGKGSIRDYIADRLLKKLEVTPSRDSNVIMIGFPRHDPISSATFTNAFADAYIQTNFELKADPARRQSSWFDAQLASLRAAVQTAQHKLSEFQRSSKLVATDDKMDVENARLTDLSTQLVTAQAAMYEARTRMDEVNRAQNGGRLSESPDARMDVALQAIKADLAQALANEAQVAQRYDRNHPLYQAAAAQVSTLQRKLDTELGAMKGALRQNAQIMSQKSAELQAAVDDQKARILELKHERDKLDVLNRDVDNAQKAYDTAIQRSGELKLEGRLDQSNVAVLSPAVPPLKQSRPILWLDLVLGLVLGTLVGIATAVMLESRDRRVRSMKQLKEFAGLTLIAEIGGLLRGPQAPRRRFLPSRRMPILFEQT